MLLLGGALVAILFVLMVHFIVRPLVFGLYEKYEPICWHYNWKLKRKLKKVLQKFKKVG